ncbi:MAG TPA: hypothetical protein VFB84_00180 [Micromonosporaceae bacterium]|nr:hypothetical protein [Micromonosporaceae bacterium]
MIGAVRPGATRLGRATVAVGLAVGLGTAASGGYLSLSQPGRAYAEPVTDVTLDPSPTPGTSLAPAPSPTLAPPAAPPPPPPLPPRLGIRLSASEVRLGADYWRGTAGFADLVITAENTSTVDERVEVVYTTPEGVSDTHAGWGGQGCAELAVRMYRCIRGGVAPGTRWTLRLRLRVEGTAWRRAPLFGSATATAVAPSHPTIPSAQDQHVFQIVFPDGPQSPGLALWAGDVVLASPAARTATLSVRVGNHGRVAAIGRLEIAVPAGATITSVPARCVAHVRLDSRRIRCELGRLGSGQVEELLFGLAVDPAGRLAAPLAGSARASLRPPQGPTAEAVATFRIVATAVASPSPQPPGGAEGGQGLPRVDYIPGAPAGATSTEYPAGLPAGPIVLGIGGLFTVLWLLVMVSLRRRLRHHAPR